jgi:hypothetical protein
MTEFEKWKQESKLYKILSKDIQVYGSANCSEEDLRSIFEAGLQAEIDYEKEQDLIPRGVIENLINNSYKEGIESERSKRHKVTIIIFIIMAVFNIVLGIYNCSKLFIK